ncbi:hypothetical protein [Komagataeibacter medellinensis]|uniref:hypothetical protein n=1 Tax=Komagataeibacter medellinensis TaxID=1177712 RepID=UPI00039DF75B|nr:hypothetical protein [Komagataeibacter medellinensis]
MSDKTNYGQPVEDTLHKTIAVGFAHATGGNPTVPAPYIMRLDMEDVDAQLAVTPNFWSVTYEVHVDLTGRVDVTDSTGNEITKAEISGSGSSSVNGNCIVIQKGIQQAIKEASKKAIRKMGSDFACKIINTNVVKSVRCGHEPSVKPLSGAAFLLRRRFL